jgi:hypothetical protein
MYVELRSSLRMSSARMKTKLGLVELVWAWDTRGALLVTAEKSRTARTIEANGRTLFLIPAPLLK